MIKMWEILTVYAPGKTDITPKFKFLILIAGSRKLRNVYRNIFSVKKKMKIGSVS